MPFQWYSDAMKTTIDRAGRVVIPKAIRDRAGLVPGAELEIRLDNGIVEISPPAPQGRLVEKEGFLVWEAAPGTPPMQPGDVRQAILDMRAEREEKFIRREP
jgi:AbrB family looped-hinge helix DNA binding protein